MWDKLPEPRAGINRRVSAAIMTESARSAAREDFMFHSRIEAKALAASALLLAVASGPRPGWAADPTVLRINTFPNAKALALQAGIAKGIYHRHGLQVELAFTESSQAQRNGLAAGKFDLAQGAID